MENVQGLEWPETRLGPLCPGEWVEEIDPEDLPGDELSSEVRWADARDKGDELADCLTGQEALDARLSLELARVLRRRGEEKRLQWSTDKVAQAFFRVRTQRDLDEAFALLQRIEDRHRICQGVIDLAVKRVVRLEREARQAGVDNLRRLNRAMSEWAQSIGYRVPLKESLEPVDRKPRDQSWVIVELRPGIGQVCRGKNAGSKTVVMCEPEIFGLAAPA